MSERIIEQDGKRFRFVERRVQKRGEWFRREQMYPGRISEYEGTSTGDRDIYELIPDKPMKLKHVIAGIEPQEYVVEWKPEVRDDGTFALHAMANGMSQCVLKINPDGTLLRLSMHSGFVLPMDERCRIKEV